MSSCNGAKLSTGRVLATVNLTYFFVLLSMLWNNFVDWSDNIMQNGHWKLTRYDSNEGWIRYIIQCSAVIMLVHFLQYPHYKHPITRLTGWGMECLLCISSLIYVLLQSLQCHEQYHDKMDCVKTNFKTIPQILQSKCDRLIQFNRTQSQIQWNHILL